MTPGALRRRIRKIAIHVTLRARYIHMRSGKREAAGAVIEFGVLPTGGGVAGVAGGRKTAGPVVGIRGPAEIGQVAALAFGGLAAELSAHMTLAARHADMRAS